MAKHRKLPVEIEAKELLQTTDSQKEIIDWVNSFENRFCYAKPALDGCVTITTLEGDMLATTGDFIIKGVNGEFYPCKPDIFTKTYELVKS